ncbi:endonuclease domain-containing protein [Salinibacterium soli]|uniref:DUF559 domain-containing protein n=1 Tax=Antiquaquibacter soli TaxID=3064523 RepID=A0ABT9BNQ1_9MICO|nr:DUF559 domain-containing protein [Protaetiibacter sp. WY-16]MDO7880917.1 DUF559 domain-containing protein [Protaetiibacter sp. WY-16]
MAPRIPLPPPLRHRTFTTAEAVAHGLGRRRLGGPDLVSPAHGVWVSRDVEVTVDMLCRSVLTRIPAGFACDATAARLWGVPLPLWCDSEPITVALDSGRAPTGRGIRGRVLGVGADELATRAGIRLTSPARTWVDLAPRLAMRDLVAAGDFLIRRTSPLVAFADLAAAVDRRAGDRGVRRLRAALPLLSDRSESRRESHLRLILARAGLGEVEVNVWITTVSGHRYRTDFAIREARIAIEYQGEYHFDPAQQRADMLRRSRLQASGWTVIEVSKDDLANPRELLTRIRNTIARR